MRPKRADMAPITIPAISPAVNNGPLSFCVTLMVWITWLWKMWWVNLPELSQDKTSLQRCHYHPMFCIVKALTLFDLCTLCLGNIDRGIFRNFIVNLEFPRCYPRGTHRKIPRHWLPPPRLPRRALGVLADKLAGNPQYCRQSIHETVDTLL